MTAVYHPSKDNIRYYMENHTAESYHQYIDQSTSENSEPISEYGEVFKYTDTDTLGCDLPDSIEALREVAEALPQRLRDVYEVMLQRAAGGADRITFTDIADKYKVSPNQIKKDQQKIEKIIIEKVGPEYQK